VRNKIALAACRAPQNSFCVVSTWVLPYRLMVWKYIFLFLRRGGSGLVQSEFETRKLGNLEKPETIFRVGEREGRKEGRNNGWMEGTYGQRAWTDARNGRKDRTDGDMGRTRQTKR
jgi:hypothetical protein